MITMVQKKGGVSKTSTCVLLADHFRRTVDEQWGMVTNDESNLSALFGDDYFLRILTMRECPEIGGADSVLVDLAGRPDQEAEQTLRTSGCLLVPIPPDRLSIESGMSVVDEALELNQNVAVIAAMASEQDKEDLEGLFKGLPVFRVRRSTMPQSIIGKQQWSDRLFDEMPILKRSWTGIMNDISTIADWARRVS